MAHASVPYYLVSGLMTTLVVFLKDDPAGVDVQNAVAANLGLLIPPETSKFLHRFATSVDLFSAWYIALLALGISAITGFKLGKSLTSVMIPWALYVLCASAWATLM